MKLYLDDVRPTPPDYERVYDYNGFVGFITANGIPDFISFDHDLGPGKTGHDCAKFLVICSRQYHQHDQLQSSQSEPRG